MENLFYTISGLPVHALVVHFAVVLLPLAAAGVIASIYSPKFRNRYVRASLLGTFLGASAAFVSKQSGEALAQRIGLPVRHSNFGTYLVVAAGVFFLGALVWNQRTASRRSSNPGAFGNGLALLGVGVIGLTFLTGHTGAQAVWEGKIAALNSPAPQTSTKTTTIKGKTISMATVKQHASASSCWVAISGNVYDLTKWINQHPGGAGVITAMCGSDGTASFSNQHGGQARPASELARFKIGALG